MRGAGRMRIAAAASAASGLVLLAFFVFVNLRVHRHARGLIFDDPVSVPRTGAALIPGAKVHTDGRPSHILHDRLVTGLALYRAGRVRKILVSGDHGTRQYDEVNRMKDFLEARGVEPADIFLDHAGFNTYDSLRRARDVFMADDIVIVTQRYHLPRALWIARGLGIRASGAAADRRTYRMIAYYRFREFFATVKAWFDTARRRPPRYGGPVIPIDGDGRLSRD